MTQHDRPAHVAPRSKFNPGLRSILRNYDAPDPGLRSILRNAVICDDITDRCVNCGTTDRDITGGLCHPCFDEYAADMAGER
jgi:hypothetical protein